MAGRSPSTSKAKTRCSSCGGSTTTSCQSAAAPPDCPLAASASSGSASSSRERPWSSDLGQCPAEPQCSTASVAPTVDCREAELPRCHSRRSFKSPRCNLCRMQLTPPGQQGLRRTWQPGFQSCRLSSCSVCAVGFAWLASVSFCFCFVFFLILQKGNLFTEE